MKAAKKTALLGMAALTAALAATGVKAEPDPEAHADLPTVEELLNKTDDLMRGTSSKGSMRMRVKTERWEREMAMDVWSKGEERTLVQITAPAKERGMATLKVENNIWNYLPKVDRTIKVPASMMSGSWMGSHFTNDDLVKDSRYTSSYDCVFKQIPPDGEAGGHPLDYVIGCIPKDDAPVVWGEVVVTIGWEHELPERVEFFDEGGELIRSMIYSDIVEIGNRQIPRRIEVIPADKPDEMTEVVYENLEFDVDIPERTFSLQSLRR